MYYAAIDIIAILVLIIENRNIIIDHNKSFEVKTWAVYRRFLFAVLAYYVVDLLWGVIEYYKQPILLFAVTTIYFVVMAMCIVLWTAGVFYYLQAKGRFVRILVWTGKIVATIITAATLLNIFFPVLFTVDSECVYEALPLRSILLALQIAILFVVSCYCFVAYGKVRGNDAEGHLRYRTVGLFGLIIALFLGAQLWFPYLPLYAIAYMMGTCLVKSYVIDDEKEKYRHELKESLKVVELKNTISSLLDNMPALTFTKEPETSMYLACNQAFAEFAGKKSPEEVVGLTDADLFDEEMAERLAQDDRMAMSMDEPYIFIEDICDTAGNQRQFQTTKYKYTDVFGRICVLGMAHETTDLAQVRREFASTKEEYEKAKANAVIFNHIAQALSYGYDELFYVRLDTEDYINYWTDDHGDFYEKRRGPKFFDSCQVEVNTLVCEEDREMFSKAMVRETLLKQIDMKRAFEMTYRVPKGGEPFFVRMRAIRALDDDNILIIGVDDVDEEMKIVRAQDLLREEDLSRRLFAAQQQANIDPMTGVRNKRAYLEAEARLDYAIKETGDARFAISIIDINDLKYVNDKFGHQAGDQHIRAACRIVCTTFKRSPVFRVGGDEFCVISQGDDYENINELLQKIEAHNREALLNGGVVIACGTALNREGETVTDVYKRADKAMYDNKVRLKNGREVR
ncbi:diguanylate cyclase (GGDEF) domain-containing protein [Ruminococcaceae bacterium YRB3002]|nr:diguanylate cyclase (GGDEF) domain-containing protein [Ruminococcaceae bacterium YRB3002]